MNLRATLFGLLGTAVLLGLYFSAVSAISGWDFAMRNFSRYGVYLVSLAVGFGVQVGLYAYLRQMVRHGVGAGAVVATGTTSSASMLACCAHYLVNIVPIIGITGALSSFASIVDRYQIPIFIVSLLISALGILLLITRVRSLKQSYAS